MRNEIHLNTTHENSTLQPQHNPDSYATIQGTDFKAEILQIVKKAETGDLSANGFKSIALKAVLQLITAKIQNRLPHLTEKECMKLAEKIINLPENKTTFEKQINKILTRNALTGKFNAMNQKKLVLQNTLRKYQIELGHNQSALTQALSEKKRIETLLEGGKGLLTERLSRSPSVSPINTFEPEQFAARIPEKAEIYSDKKNKIQLKDTLSRWIHNKKAYAENKISALENELKLRSELSDCILKYNQHEIEEINKTLINTTKERATVELNDKNLQMNYQEMPDDDNRTPYVKYLKTVYSHQKKMTKMDKKMSRLSKKQSILQHEISESLSSVQRVKDKIEAEKSRIPHH